MNKVCLAKLSASRALVKSRMWLQVPLGKPTSHIGPQLRLCVNLDGRTRYEICRSCSYQKAYDTERVRKDKRQLLATCSTTDEHMDLAAEQASLRISGYLPDVFESRYHDLIS